MGQKAQSLRPCEAFIKAAQSNPKQPKSYYFSFERNKATKQSIILQESISTNKIPNIVESWKYYQEFIKMCEELD